MSDLLNIKTQCLDASAPQLFQDLIHKKRAKVNAEDIQNWSHVNSRSDWEAYCHPRIEALQKSLGQFPPPPNKIHIHTTGQIEGDGYTIQNIVFESRENIFVSANHYLPRPKQPRNPGIILVNSHHNPKIQGELQDMGILWARSGCQVLVIDPFGYGDRRDHQFAPRQDYWFRNITGMQLHTLGDSLMGWMVWDIHRCVDLLLAQENVDPRKIIVMGSVAGGGDPCAVAAALDARISCAVPFNFGGPQPETPFPLPDDSESTFNYLGSGSWESTRNLRSSGQNGFLPWLIVGCIAPRRLIYAHEFEWDSERDPVWKRLQQIYAWYDASDQLDYTLGFGELKDRPPKASHCNNIGVPHRQRIYTALEKWYGIAPPTEEREERYPEEKLQSLTFQFRQTHQVPPVHTVLQDLGTARSAQASSTHTDLQTAWENILGDINPQKADSRSLSHEIQGNISIERTILSTEVPIPIVLLAPPEPRHLVITIAQDSKQNLLRERSEAYTALLNSGIALCLPDLPGVGETAPNNQRHFRGATSALSANLLMFGQTSLGTRLKALRTILLYLRGQYFNLPLSLWGDSLASTNSVDFQDPLIDAEPIPHQAEPAGGLLALLATLFEPDIHALAIRGTIATYQGLLENTFCYVPQDAVVPGALLAGDINTIPPFFAPKPLLITDCVDGRNCLLSDQAFHQTYRTTSLAYESTPDNLNLHAHANIEQWFIQNLT